MKKLLSVCLCLIVCLELVACGNKEPTIDEGKVEENQIVGIQETAEDNSEGIQIEEDNQFEEPLAFKTVENIKKDILDNTDIVGMTENMYSEYYACFNDIYLNDSEYIQDGYTATCMVEFTGGEYMLTQNYSLFYKVNEKGDNWELCDYVAIDEMEIVNCVEDTSNLDDSYFDEGYDNSSELGERYYTSSDLCGTYVYQAVKFPDNNRGGMDRKLWTVIITDDSEGNYYMTSYTIGANEYEITSTKTEGDAICLDRYPVYYDSISNTMKSVSQDITIFNYVGDGATYCNRDFIKISANELSTQEIVNTWISSYDV